MFCLTHYVNNPQSKPLATSEDADSTIISEDIDKKKEIAKQKYDTSIQNANQKQETGINELTKNYEITVQMANQNYETRVNAAQSKFESAKQNAEKAQEPRLVLICVAITALFLSLLTLLLVYFKTRNSLSKKKAEAFISDYLNNYRDDSKSYNEFIKKLDSRVWHLEKLMRQTSSNSQGEQINESYFPDLRES